MTSELTLLDRVKAKDNESIALILRSKCDLDQHDETGGTPLIYATLSGDIGLVQALIGAGANVNYQDNNGWTALTYAMLYGDSELAQLYKSTERKRRSSVKVEEASSIPQKL